MLQENSEVKTKYLLPEEEAFLYLIRRGIHSEYQSPNMKVDTHLCEALFLEGKYQSLLPLLYKGVESVIGDFDESRQECLDDLLSKISKEDRRRTLGAYHLYHEADKIIKDLEALGIECYHWQIL